jgi:hypothetical protein
MKLRNKMAFCNMNPAYLVPLAVVPACAHGLFRKHCGEGNYFIKDDIEEMHLGAD